mgnify:CR=1 FL=1
MDDIVEKDLSYSIVKAAYEVFNELGPGFAESIYEEAMIVVLKKYVHILALERPDRLEELDANTRDRLDLKQYVDMIIN